MRRQSQKQSCPSRRTYATTYRRTHANRYRRRSAPQQLDLPSLFSLVAVTGQKWVVDSATTYPLTNRNVFIPLPAEVIAFIKTFDATGIGRPFTFKLEIPA